MFCKDASPSNNTDNGNNIRNTSPNADALGASMDGNSGESYIWNYFPMGVDVIFSGRTHTVKKMVLNTNIPGHPDFNR